MIKVKSLIPGLWAPDYAVALGDHNVRSHAASYRKLVRELYLTWTILDQAISIYYCVY